MSAKSINYFFTNHESCEEGGFSSYYPTLYRERYVIQDFTHSHPHNKIPSKDDYQAIYYLKKNQETFTTIIPFNYIYFVKERQYIPFSVSDNHKNNLNIFIK